jgi:hypothetical protein
LPIQKTYKHLAGVVGSLVAFGLMAYAAHREQTTDDKSERFSPKSAALLFCGIGLWIAFVFYYTIADLLLPTELVLKENQRH